MRKTAEGLNTQYWKRLKGWSEWWFRPNHLKMFTKAYTLIDGSEWEKGPKTTNPVESINRQSIHTKGCALFALLENIFLEDRGHAAKVVATGNNVSLSYASNEETRRKKRRESRKRKRSSLGEQTDDNAPPDKRRNIEKRQKKRQKGRALIGKKLMVEYQEMNGDKMENIGWFSGEIVAYNRRDGYFVEFQEKRTETQTYKGWSEWIEDIDSPDVEIQE